MISTDDISTFNLQDLILLPLLIFILFFIYKKQVLAKVKEDKQLTRIFITAFLFKIFCTFFHSLINEFYYLKSVDSISYYTQMLNIRLQLSENERSSLWDFYFNRDAFTANTGMEFDQFGSDVTANMPLLILPLGYLFFNSYLCISFFLGFIALMACHKLYIVFSAIFPDCKKQAAIAAVLLPGVCFWSSIILKDTFSLIGLGYGLWFFWKITIKKRVGIFNIIGFTLSLALMYYFKPYILVVVFSFFLWFILYRFQKIKSGFMRFFALIFFAAIGTAAVTMTLNELSDLETGPLAAYKAENITGQLENFQQYYSGAEGGGSSFSLGQIDFTSPASVLSATPKALSAVFFQPFIWEAGKPIMLLSAAESIFILYLFLYAVFKSRILGFFGIIFKSPFLLSFFLFCLFFGTIVAFAAPNFGTLARYKIPAMPFIVFILLIVKFKIKQKALLKKQLSVL